MDKINQGKISSGSLIHHVLKQKRGRPRKDRTLQDNATIQAPAGFGGAKDHIPQTSDRKDGVDPTIGQPVTGIVVATFDAGYLLNVNIGNTSTNLSGLVFKHGCYVPVTSENDIAPHMQMIERNEFSTPRTSQGWSQNLNLSTQNIRRKGKYTSRRRVDSSPLASGRGKTVPAVLQPVNAYENSNQMSSAAPRGPQLMDVRDEDVREVEPLSVLPPTIGLQVSIRSEKSEIDPSDKSVSGDGQGEKDNLMKSTETYVSPSLHTDHSQTGNSEDKSKSMPEDPRVFSKIGNGNNNAPFMVESMHTVNFANQPLFVYGTRNMTELLQAVQENAKDIQAQQTASAFKLEVSETRDRSK